MDEPKDILACPFCGKPAQLTEEGRGQYKVTCSFVGACYGNWRPDYSTPEAAIHRWNMRAGGMARGATDGSRLGAVSWVAALAEIMASAEGAGELASADEGAKCGEVFNEIKSKAENLIRQIESASTGESLRSSAP